MESNHSEIRQLQSRLDVLLHKQNKLQENATELREETRDLQIRINHLASQIVTPKEETPTREEETPEAIIPKQPIEVEEIPVPIAETKTPDIRPVEPVPVEETTPQPTPRAEEKWEPLADLKSTVASAPREKSSIESFLGENLANKIGIAIILIGIGVGVKYAIDKNILGPAMRIALGYLAGAILIGFALYLKKKYENLSAVMFAGGMAVAYFVTFIAYDFYQLFPKMVAFGSMLVFTVITSLVAIRYNKQVIAIVGLVGAYAVPFLLSDGSGTTFALFVYMSIINAGILFLAFRKNWQPVFAVAFGLSWLIFFVMFLRAIFWKESDYTTLFAFGNVFYALFYSMLIANKMKYKNDMGGGTTIVILNSVFAYIFGIFLVNELYRDDFINGGYTLIFAASQGLVAFITSKRKEDNLQLYYLSFGFALIYATISVPMMFDGNWITILWALQAALFFWISTAVGKRPEQKKDDPFFGIIAYIPMALSFISLIAGWMEMSSIVRYSSEPAIQPVFNEYFLSGVVVTAVLFFTSYIKRDTPSTTDDGDQVLGPMSQALIYFGVLILFISMAKEIDVYWDQQAKTDAFKTTFFNDFFSSTDKLKIIWILILGLIYLGALQLANRFTLKDKSLSMTLGITSSAVILLFLTIGLFNMSLLRDRALLNLHGHKIADYSLTYSIRYIGYLALAFTLAGNWIVLRYLHPEKALKRALDIVMHICIIWIACSELIHLKRMNGGGDFYRAGLTIFGGIYAFGLIAFGIWKKKVHLRLLALILFGITLIKLFVYDIANVDSGGKTIAFISLGVLLLVISFLYTKYKHLILPSDDEE